MIARMCQTLAAHATEHGDTFSICRYPQFLFISLDRSANNSSRPSKIRGII